MFEFILSVSVWKVLLKSKYKFFLYLLVSNMAENNLKWKSKYLFICKHLDMKKCWHSKNQISKKKIFESWKQNPDKF